MRTNSVESKIDKQSVSPLYWLCRGRDETISHVVAECKILAKKQYRLCQHDRVGEIVYWVMCKRHGFSHAVKWYEHTLENVLENDNVKILWDFSVQTNQKLEHSKPNILIVMCCNLVSQDIPTIWIRSIWWDKKLKSNSGLSKHLILLIVVYTLRDRGQNNLFFSCVLRKQKEKNKACILALYQDVLIFSSLKDTKND